MQATCAPLDASHLLRDILQSKENYQTEFINNSSSSNRSSIKDVFTPVCSSEMLSPLLQSKSGDVAYHVRDSDNDLDNDGDIDVASDNNSCANGGDQSDDLDERSLDASTHEEALKNVDNGSNQWETKEAKRAHVESILTNMKQSPPQDTLDSSSSALTGDFKRQKRKQPQPQQHDSSPLHSEELALQRQILQLQEQMQAVKRKREKILSVNDDYDDIIDDDLTEGEDSRSGSPVTGVSKRARVEHILNSIRSSPQIGNGFEFSNQFSLGSENSKKQKRKQTQPQQHDSSRSEQRKGSLKHNDNCQSQASKSDEMLNNDESDNNNNPSGTLGTNDMFRINFYRGLADKDFIPLYHNGFDPQLYRENIFRHNFLGLRPDLDPMAALKNASKTIHPRNEPRNVMEEQLKFQAADLDKIAVALKAELSHAVSKAIDSAVSKVFSDKPGVQGDQSFQGPECNIPKQNLQDGTLQHHHQQQKPHHPVNHFPHFLQPHQQVQQHRFHHQQQQQPPSGQISEREALKETVNNSQGKKKPDLLVPFSDHLHFLERFGSRFQQEKLSAFDSLNKSENDLVTPHSGPSIPFHPHFPYYLPTQVLPPMYTGEPEQTEALSLIVNAPKKKRTKVTDTRLSSPRGKPALLQDNTPSSSMDHADAQRHMAVTFPHFLPPVLSTSMTIANPSLGHSDLLAVRLREATFGERLIPSPQDQPRGSPRSLTDSPHFMSKMDMFDRGSVSMAGDLMDGSSGSGNGLLISF